MKYPFKGDRNGIYFSVKPILFAIPVLREYTLCYIRKHTVECWEENTWTICLDYCASMNLDIELLFYVTLFIFSGNVFSLLGSLMFLLQLLLALLYIYPALFSTSYKGKNMYSSTSPLPTNSNYTGVFPWSSLQSSWEFLLRQWQRWMLAFSQLKFKIWFLSVRFRGVFVLKPKCVWLHKYWDGISVMRIQNQSLKKNLK